MDTKYCRCILLICILIVACTPPASTPLPQLPVADPPDLIPEPLVPLPTAVTKENISCYTLNNKGYDITISPFVIVGILSKNSNSDWVQVRINEVVDCWVEVRTLNLGNTKLDAIPTSDISIPQIPTQTSIPTFTTTVDIPATPPARLEIRWKILSYDCSRGRVTGLTIDLDVEGGIKDYSFSPSLPIYVKPEQFLSIKVLSGTTDGEPSGTIAFSAPKALDTSFFECVRSGNRPVPNPPPTEPPVNPPPDDPPVDPPPTDPPVDPPPVCYDQKGKEIPCK